MADLITLEKPELPLDWEYEKSVQKVQALIFKWKNLTEELIGELWIAREMLSEPGRPWPEEINGTKVPVKTWTNYCQDIGKAMQKAQSETQ